MIYKVQVYIEGTLVRELEVLGMDAVDQVMLAYPHPQYDVEFEPMAFRYLELQRANETLAS